MQEIAGIGWLVECRPMMTASKFNIKEQEWYDFSIEVPDSFSIVRTSDNKVLDTCGSRYQPVQNHRAMSFFKEMVEAGDATIETMGSLKGGRYVWGLANLKQSFTLPGKDEVKGYLLVACPHEQGKSFIIKWTTIRVVCMNTLALALMGGAEFRMSHRMEFNEDQIDKAKETLGLAREKFGNFEANERKLKKLKLNEKDAIRVIGKIMQPQMNVEQIEDMADDFDENGSPRMVKILHAYHNAPGADPGTGWGVLNAVTYFADHIAGRTRDKRLTNAWFGRTARQKEKLLNELLRMAA